MTTETEIARFEEQTGLEVALTRLVSRVDVLVGPTELRRAARSAAGGDAATRLIDACAMVGLRARLRTGTPAEVFPDARPDLPVVACLGEGFAVLERWSFGAAKVFFQASGRERAVRPTDPAFAGVSEWIYVEPAFSGLGGVGDHEDHPPPIRRLWALLRVEGSDLGVVAVHAVGVGILTLATPLAVQALVNWLAFGIFFQPILVLSLLLTLFLGLAATLRAMQRFTVEIVQRRLFVRLVNDVTLRMVRAKSSAFTDQYGPELVNRFFDIFTVQKAISVLILDGFTASLTAAVGLLVLAVYHPFLLVFDVLILLAMVAVAALGRGAERTAIKESKRKYEVVGWLEELARLPSVFRQGGSGLALDRSDALTREFLIAREGHFRIFFRQYVAVQLVQVGIGAALLVVCGWLVMQGELTLGQLVAAEFIVAAALGGFAKFAEKLDTIYDLLAALDKIGHLTDLPQERRDGFVPQVAGPASLALQGAEHTWATGAHLGPLVWSIAPGERVAVLGDAGSGKSTLADLVAGHRQPEVGRVFRDGHDLSVLRPERVHAEVAIARSGEILQASVLDNLTLGRAIPEAEVWEVLRALGLDQVVSGLPGGLSASLVARGAPLSEGQVRALIVARAILAKPRLLIIDGLLDGVPFGARQPMLDVLLAGRDHWTLLVLTEDRPLAHRLDRTFELVHGGLVERTAPRTP